MADRADLDAHAEAMRQVVAERSADSLDRLDDRADVTATAGLSEHAEVDLWAIASSNPEGFLLDSVTLQDTL
jgi:hypothetical protein